MSAILLVLLGASVYPLGRTLGRLLYARTRPRCTARMEHHVCTKRGLHAFHEAGDARWVGSE